MWWGWRVDVEETLDSALAYLFPERLLLLLGQGLMWLGIAVNVAMETAEAIATDSVPLDEARGPIPLDPQALAPPPCPPSPPSAPLPHPTRIQPLRRWRGLTGRPGGRLQERVLVDRLATALVGGFVLAAAALLLGIEAPYGRYSRAGWGMQLPGKVAWVLQELPNLLAVYWAVSLSLRSEEPEKRAALASPANRVLLAMFTLHYINRTVIFPLRLRGGKDTPLLPFLMATIFCTLNGYMQARTLTALRAYPDDWLLDPRFICGPPTTPSLPSTPATAS